MHAFLIVGNNTEKEILSKISQLNISPWDIIRTSGAGIDDIKEFCQALSISPQGAKKLGVIEQMERLTSDAQNALLKTLEEPPIDTYILGTTNNIDAVLPTIVSRMHITYVVSQEASINTTLLHALMTKSPGKRLQMIEPFITTRDEAKKILLSLLDQAHQDFSDPALIRRLLTALSQLSVNVNQRLVVDNALL